MGDGGRRDLEWEVVLIEQGLSSTPDAGENLGRNLNHASTVRASGSAPAGVDRIVLTVPETTDRTRASLVVLARVAGEPDIIGARSLDLPPMP